METIKLGGVTLGAGKPKICVPLMAFDKDELVRQARAAETLPCQLLEFRADHLEKEGWRDRQALAEMTHAIKEVIQKPLILTIRTADEGGLARMTRTEYYSLLRDLAEDAACEAIDIEPFDTDADFDEERIRFLASCVQEEGKKVIFSNHDFSGTPDVDVMVRRLYIMQELGADIPKIAVMPHSEDDVINLLTAACVMRDEYAKRPFIALSMGELGKETRICGGEFGSCITFASGGASLQMGESAPGQMDAATLDAYICAYYGDKL